MSLPVDEKTFFGQPRALATLFFTEMWERFSFYGMRAILVLYLIAPPDGATVPGGGLGFNDADAAAIYGTYVSLIYLLPLVGGWVADRLTGPRKAVLIGGIVIAAGHFLMAVPLCLRLGRLLHLLRHRHDHSRWALPPRGAAYQAAHGGRVLGLSVA
jgi:POT family proton-dependent oligopeptide transporter